MVLSDIVTANNVALALVLGGLLAVFTALYGKKEDSILDTLLMIVGFFFGAFLVFLGIEAAVLTPRPVASIAIAVTLALGFAMFLKPLRKIPFSMIVSLIAGGVVLADFRLVGIPQFQIRKRLALGLDAQNRQIGMLIRHNGLRIELAPVRQHDANLIGIRHDVPARHDQPVRAHDDARAKRFFKPLPRQAFRHRITEKLPEKRIVEQRRNALLHGFLGVDVHDGRRDLLDERREGQGYLRAGLGEGGFGEGRGCAKQKRHDNKNQGREGLHEPKIISKSKLEKMSAEKIKSIR